MTFSTINWEALSRAFVHPLRVSILEVLAMDGGRVLSATELSHELQAHKSRTIYHVEELAKAGLLELIETRPVRGATEHFYALGAGQ